LGEVLFLWGDQFAKAGEFEQAAAHYREALRYRADDAELHMSLGVALARLHRPAEAGSEFQAALRIDPNFQAARKALGEMQERKQK
jgi:Flp pilus assembly protein TadD